MHTRIDQIPFRLMDGGQATLSSYRGKAVLLVNVASQCGLTPQYEGLARLFEEKREAGLVVIGFPANDFGAQEPGSNEEIAQFCNTTFGVAFPLAEKVSVKGPDRHALYAALTQAQPEALDPAGGTMHRKLAQYGFEQEDPSDVLWNFEKFLVGRDGRVVARFNPDVEPGDPLLREAIDSALHG
ncbi:glutathione peroxidase [Pseudoduganella umbonata]|uniref:Glutathione peroxidase n=1 Tax=Pseudoduganella umbonata TaxID=864828 RepID=A0A4P8HND5_9BURK|nr:glutathione peroxidase [Pseudoduganella umbonata]MBB3219915.1 glutathione peroxidase [Pseudoduganella umbonata]QCP09932.1 glutathione peroxidase [Pseudoduganella umbonata]